MTASIKNLCNINKDKIYIEHLKPSNKFGYIFKIKFSKIIKIN